MVRPVGGLAAGTGLHYQGDLHQVVCTHSNHHGPTGDSAQIPTAINSNANTRKRFTIPSV
jgi:hypothetical protein